MVLGVALLLADPVPRRTACGRSSAHGERRRRRERIAAGRRLNKSFGSVIAASNINVVVDDREIVGIIGANGAGKTTFVNLVTGYLKPIERHHRISRPRHHRTGRRATSSAAGISRSFQVPQVFGTATVFDNLLIACGIAQGGRFPLWRSCVGRSSSPQPRR